MGRSSLLVQVVRASQRAARDAERARNAQARAQARYQAQASREAKRAWLEDMQGEAESMTDELQDQLEEIDGILDATLDKDDYFELEDLRKSVSHPAFSSKHEVSEEAPELATISAEPILSTPVLLKVFGWAMPSSARQKLIDKAAERHSAAIEEWKLLSAEIESSNSDLTSAWEVREEKRRQRLEKDKERYKEQCLAREIEIQKANAELDALIAGLPKGKRDAVETYAELVLGESEYPEGVEPDYEISFDELSRELTIGLRLVSPQAIPDVASYRFQKSSGEILEKKQTAKEIRSRYEGYVGNCVLRTIHEILEADRVGVVRLISVVASVDHVSPSTGTPSRATLVEVATDRESFLSIDLRNVVALETLKHLGGAVSKNMINLTPVQGGRSVRRA